MVGVEEAVVGVEERDKSKVLTGDLKVKMVYLFVKC